jgi:hypothetical protein
MYHLSQGHAIALAGSGFSPWRPGFDFRPIHVGFVVDIVSLG